MCALCCGARPPVLRRRRLHCSAAGSSPDCRRWRDAVSATGVRAAAAYAPPGIDLTVWVTILCLRSLDRTTLLKWTTHAPHPHRNTCGNGTAVTSGSRGPPSLWRTSRFPASFLARRTACSAAMHDRRYPVAAAGIKRASRCCRCRRPGTTKSSLTVGPRLCRGTLAGRRRCVASQDGHHRRRRACRLLGRLLGVP